MLKYKLEDVLLFTPEDTNTADLATITKVILDVSRIYPYQVTSFGIEGYFAKEEELTPATDLLKALF